MNNFIQKLFLNISNSYEILKRFGILTFIYDILKRYVFRSNGNVLGRFLYYKRYENIKKNLKTKYSSIIDKYKSIDKSVLTDIKDDCPIWVFWWQGINNDTPQTVSDCINSIQRNKKNHTLIILDRNNYSKYVTLPDIYTERLKRKEITLTHFSDLLRVELLKQQGGIWFDATIILTRQIPVEVFSYPFFTVKHGLYSNFHVCKGLWSGFALATCEHNPMFEYLSEMFQAYWQDEDVLVCYLLIDAFIALGYENIPWIKNMIDNVPYNNADIFFVDDYGNEIVHAEDLPENYIYKIHYKRKFNKKNSEGMTTVYGMVTE